MYLDACCSASRHRNRTFSVLAVPVRIYMYMHLWLYRIAGKNTVNQPHYTRLHKENQWIELKRYEVHSLWDAMISLTTSTLQSSLSKCVCETEASPMSIK